MKIQYKAAIIMALFGSLIVFFLSYGFDIQNHSIAINNELKNIKNLSEEASLYLQSHLHEKASIALTITTAPCLKEALRQSNQNFSSLDDEQRDFQINSLNQRWRETNNIRDPFINSYMTNPAAKYLKAQQVIMPEMYGEIFLTNRYGALVGTTGKLTTLAHAHKYWWVASYNDGKGRIFLDDRGFDESVDGYVLGVVVPVKDEEDIIGILKCNINIASPLTHIVEEYNHRNFGNLKIARTGGLVIREDGVTPLSTKIPDSILGALREKRINTTIISEKGVKQLVAMAPVEITMGSSEIGFGGSKESIDHIKGNTGEGWHTIIFVPQKKAVEVANQTTRLIFFAGLLFLFLVVVIALFLGRFIAKPIVNLAKNAGQIGRGSFQTRVKILSNDEIGYLAKSFNRMVVNLDKTMTSRDNLQAEVEQRKKTEAEKEKVIIELNEALSKVELLSGFLPICVSCKKIRDDNGYWNRIESYIKAHSMAEFSHSICPECAKRLYPEIYDKDDTAE